MANAHLLISGPSVPLPAAGASLLPTPRLQPTHRLLTNIIHVFLTVPQAWNTCFLLLYPFTCHRSRAQNRPCEGVSQGKEQSEGLHALLASRGAAGPGTHGGRSLPGSQQVAASDQKLRAPAPLHVPQRRPTPTRLRPFSRKLKVLGSLTRSLHTPTAGPAAH